MPTTVLVTKLYPPPPKADLVKRQDLIDRLSDGLDRKVALISAPAGFGKSTLVGDWLEGLKGGEAAWLSLDEDDSDPSRFLTYLISALARTQRLGGDFGKGALGMLQSPQPPPVQSVLIPILNEIAEVSGKIVLVLDDFHLIDSQEVQDTLSYFLEHLPPQLHLVIATRQDPQLPLGRLRAQGQLTELRAADLRFSNSEAADFLNRLMGLDLSSEEINELETKTEGWIAGLQLAAISMHGSDDIQTFIRSFQGSHRLVLDFLIEEVMSHQGEEIQDFLLRTSILGRLTGPLCDALTERDDGQQMLEELYRANLFIVPLDEERHWYRYHHLFIDLLNQRLRSSRPDSISKLHASAVKWYEDQNYLPEAIHHAFMGDDIPTATRLIEKVALEALRRSDLKSILNLVDRLPENAEKEHPWLFAYHSWALLLTGQIEAVSPRLEDTEWMLDSISDNDVKNQEMVGYIAGMKAILNLWQRDFKNGLDFANQAIDNLPENNWIRGYCAIVLGSSYWGSGDLRSAKDAYKESYSVGKASGNMLLAVSGGCNLAHAIELEGRLQDALELFQDLFKLTKQDGYVLPVAGYIHVEIARLFYEFNKLDLASQHLIDGIQLCKQLADGRAETIGYGLLTRVQLAQGDIPEAATSITNAIDANPSPDTPFDLRGGEYPEVWLWLMVNDFENLEMWLQESEVNLEGLSYFKKMSFSMHARVMIALGREYEDENYINDALKLLDELLEVTEIKGWGKKVVEILTLKALANDVIGKTTQALSLLERALTLAESGCFIRSFVDEGPPMAQLLYQALQKGIVSEYIQHILAAFPASEPDQTRMDSTRGKQTGLVEPLTEREIEILELIAEGLTNQLIAENLIISPHTVKTHIRNIYAKLDVNNRTLAIGKARTLGIIPAPQ